eukprot:PLAT3271.21.p2 GENE.PLAT3271.21~~PLAT3271.21.p2  ORF type:complete len:276 (+),score=98.19 PLAT3271.21:105-932(+)
MAEDNFSLKIRSASTTRRMTFPLTVMDSVHALRAAVSEHMGECKDDTLSYYDEVGDLISVASDADMAQLRRHLSKGTVLLLGHAPYSPFVPPHAFQRPPWARQGQWAGRRPPWARKGGRGGRCGGRGGRGAAARFGGRRHRAAAAAAAVAAAGGGSWPGVAHRCGFRRGGGRGGGGRGGRRRADGCRRRAGRAAGGGRRGRWQRWWMADFENDDYDDAAAGVGGSGGDGVAVDDDDDAPLGHGIAHAHAVGDTVGSGTDEEEELDDGVVVAGDDL